MVRRTKEELIAEIDKIALAVELFDDLMAGQAGQEAFFGNTPKKDKWVAGCLAEGATLSQILAGYKQALNDTNVMLNMQVEESPEFVATFFKMYREKTSREYFEDFDTAPKIAKAILRRGVIADETEFYLLNDIMSDTEQTVFKGKGIARVEAMLGLFEDSHKGEG
jgi:hypothetical protein